MPSVTIRISPALHESLTKRCAHRDMTLSDLIRELLERVDDHMAKAEDAPPQLDVIQPPQSLPYLPKRRPGTRPSGFRPLNWDGKPLDAVRQPYQKGGKK